MDESIHHHHQLPPHIPPMQRSSPAFEHGRRAEAPREPVNNVQRPSPAYEHGRRAAAPREAVYNVQRPSPAFEYHTGTAIGRRGYLTPSGRQRSSPVPVSNLRPVIATPVALFPSATNSTQYTRPRRSRDAEVMQTIYPIRRRFVQFIHYIFA